jgi:alkylation response protein AidB-like acyl-CoA dehydrogenase
VTLGELHERLLGWAGADERKEWLLAARREHFGRAGEPHEDDKSHETRMNGLLDFYLFDFRPDGTHTTLELFLRDGADGLDTDARAEMREMGRCPRSLCEVRAVRTGEVELEDVVTGARRRVVERRAVVGLAKGDLLEARLLPWHGQLHFSSFSLYHPREVRRRILAEVKKRKRQAGPTGTVDVPALLDELSRMALRLERYRNVRVESIYDFAPPGRPGA